VTMSGALRFGRYAFPPNRLGYCGPPDHKALLEYVASGEADGGLLELARRFDGAYPYLQLIAHANGTDDAFDDRVVEAYWVGNELLASVVPAAMQEHAGERFAARMRRDEYRWLLSKLDVAHPHHNFHVFEIYKRAGLNGDPGAAVAIGAMDSCRVSWGTVKSAEAGQLLIERQPLALVRGKLALGAAELRSISGETGGLGFVGGAKPGDVVSVHWDWACEVLSTSALSRLQAVTHRYMALSNETL
jgi:Family of unknown function (DUF6390)